MSPSWTRCSPSTPSTSRPHYDWAQLLGPYGLGAVAYCLDTTGGPNSWLFQGWCVRVGESFLAQPCSFTT
jgi:hypothetical protein